MAKRISFTLSLILVIAFVMSGCSHINEGQEIDRFQEYYDSRVQYVGNNSKVSELLNVLGAGDLGEYTITLKTDKEPYGLEVSYSKLNNLGDEEKFENIYQIDYAYYALALIENLDVVDINYNGHTYQLTAKQANELVSGDIKDYGSSKEKLKILNDILNPAD